MDRIGFTGLVFILYILLIHVNIGIPTFDTGASDG